MSNGVIYILTNPSFPQYVKIGYADNVELRLKQLNNSECIPFAFRIYATYEVEERLTDLKLHALIDQLNPNLRSIDNIGGKKRVREFYAMAPEQAYSILETIAILGGRKERLKLWELSEEERQDVELAGEIEEEHIERLSPFTFSKCNIPVGSIITYINRGKTNSGIEAIVIDDKNVEYQGKKYSLSALATELSGSKHGVAGPRYFKYKGEWLNTIRARVEGWKAPDRIEDVWIIPCNPKLYDVVAAFDALEEIEWTQTTNTTIGDTVYVYVGGEFKSIMYKCIVTASDMYGNRSDEDGYPKGFHYWAIDDGKFIGELQLRPEFSDRILNEVGNIGYAVKISEWGKGYGTEMLRQGLEIAKGHGMDGVLILINEDNVASIRLCEKLGGVFEDTIDAYNDVEGYHKLRKYWITL